MSANNERIYLSPLMGGEEIDYIHDAFDKNWIAPLGVNLNGYKRFSIQSRKETCICRNLRYDCYSSGANAVWCERRGELYASYLPFGYCKSESKLGLRAIIY